MISDVRYFDIKRNDNIIEPFVYKHPSEMKSKSLSNEIKEEMEYSRLFDWKLEADRDEATY